METTIKMQTSETAQLLGIHDRGILEEGYKADINVIDYKNLFTNQKLLMISCWRKKTSQKASGYKYTIVSGEVAFEDEPTGALNGKLIRNLN